MTEKSQTKDERFIIKAYKTALKLGDRAHPVDKYAVGHDVGLHPRAVDAICNLMVRSNFIKKTGEKDIIITEQGERLVNRLLEG